MTTAPPRQGSGARVRVGSCTVEDRLDRALAAEFPELSRRAARALIASGCVFVDGVRCRVAARVVKRGVKMLVHPLDALDPGSLAGFSQASAEAGARAGAGNVMLPVLYEDSSLLVVDKPPGIHVHMTETRADPSVVECLPLPLYPVHRLDRGTSGVLLLAKDRETAARLADAFRNHRMRKRYVAVAAGLVEDGRIEAPIGRDPRRPRLYATRPDGRPAATQVLVLGVHSGLSALSVEPETGRTHQIRVHLASVGAPLVGDRTYGGPTHVRVDQEVVTMLRPALHARSLTVPLEAGGERTFTAPLPGDLRAFAEAGLVLGDASA